MRPRRGFHLRWGLPHPLAGNGINNGLPWWVRAAGYQRHSQFVSTTLSSIVGSANLQSRPSMSSCGCRYRARVVVRLSGYGTGVRAFIPDVLVGSTGSAATSAASFLSGVNGGTYTPGSGQLLLVSGSRRDANGAGGAPLQGAPAATTSLVPSASLQSPTQRVCCV